MAIRWLAVLCAWALIAEFTLSLPEGEYPEELDLDGPVDKIRFLYLRMTPSDLFKQFANKPNERGNSTLVNLYQSHTD